MKLQGSRIEGRGIRSVTLFVALCVASAAWAETVTTSTTPLTLQVTVESYVYTGAGAASWTLPAVSGNQGRSFVFANRSAAGAITLNRAGSDSIWKDGATSASVTISAGTTLTLVNDGAYWTALSGGGGLASSQIDTSAELAAIVGDETGTAGSLVFSTGPTISSPTINTLLYSASHITTGAGAEVNLFSSGSTGASTRSVTNGRATTLTPLCGSVSADGYWGWNSVAANTNVDAGNAGNNDVRLYRDAANTLALRNGTNAQTLNIYNTYTSGSLYERLSISALAGQCRISTNTVGGVIRSLEIGTEGNNDLQFRTNATNRWTVRSDGHFYASTDNTYDIGGGTGSNPRNVYAGTSMQVISNTGYIGIGASTPDVFLYRDAANALALRNGTNAQGFNIYNTYTSSTNYERGELKWSGNEFQIRADKGSIGGSARSLTLESLNAINFKGNGLYRWQIDATSGHFLAGTDNTYDIGASGATRPRTGYFGTSLVVGAGTDPKLICNRTAATDYARLMFQTGGTEMWALGPRGDNGGSGINNTLSLTGNAGDSYPVVFNVIPGGANYTLEVGAAHKLKASGKFSHGTAGALTIATGVITVTKGYHAVDTEAAAATDELDTISGGAEGDRVILRAANAARTVVVKDGTGNLKLAGDCTLDNSEDTIELIHDGTNWLEVCRSNNGA